MLKFDVKCQVVLKVEWEWRLDMNAWQTETLWQAMKSTSICAWQTWLNETEIKMHAVILASFNMFVSLAYVKKKILAWVSCHVTHLFPTKTYYYLCHVYIIPGSGSSVFVERRCQIFSRGFMRRASGSCSFFFYFWGFKVYTHGCTFLQVIPGEKYRSWNSYISCHNFPSDKEYAVGVKSVYLSCSCASYESYTRQHPWMSVKDIPLTK